jgi:DNA-binding response OmpR family regulator
MRSILVVEDEPGIREMLREALKDAGLDSVGAATGDCASRLVENTTFRLIVTDINLPGQLDGISLAQSIRQKLPSMPILFISGRVPKLDEARVVKAPVSFLAKPFVLDIFVEQVQALLTG